MNNKEQILIFSKNLRRYISKSGKMQKEIAKEMSISTSTLNNWCMGNSMPKMGKIQELADYFQIGKSALLDNLSDAELAGANDFATLQRIHRLTPANRIVLESTLSALLAQQEQIGDTQ